VSERDNFEGALDNIDDENVVVEDFLTIGLGTGFGFSSALFVPGLEMAGFEVLRDKMFDLTTDSDVEWMSPDVSFFADASSAGGGNGTLRAPPMTRMLPPASAFTEA
jgi:hypothetical protein